MKELGKEMKITDWEKIFVNHEADKVLLFRIYKELPCALSQSKKCPSYES